MGFGTLSTFESQASGPNEMTAQRGHLIVEGLNVSYIDDTEEVRAAVDVGFFVEKGEVLGIVGESGSGKSSVASALMRLLPKSARVRGRILLEGDDLASLPEREMRRVRGRRIGMIFQDPATALNPVFTIRSQIVDTVLRHHSDLSRRQANALAVETVESMGVAAGRLDSYPHQLSGGMRQRALIAAAMVAGPSFLVADEPTSDLDTISQAQILGLLRNLRDNQGVGLILISHDLAVISAACDRVLVMYGGYVVERGTVDDVLTKPLHPYTESLLRISRKDQDANGRFITAPRLDTDGTSVECPYVGHCPKSMPICHEELPAFRKHVGRDVRCFLYPNGSQ
jgi:peptide/nickel transport system ATP-binding protein